MKQLIIKDYAGNPVFAVNEGESEQIKDTFTLIPTTTVVETAMNYILKLENNTLKLSRDCGVTWQDKANTFGTIAHAHFFGDGTLLLCTWEKAYWTTDFVTFTETAIYDENGNPWTCESGGYHFFWQQKCDSVEVIDGVEMHYWGDYRLTGNVRLWYTTDNGRTLKCAFNFGTSRIDGSIVSARHPHQFIYNKYDGYFYVTTGDHDGAVEIHLMRGKYSVQNDSWTWEMVGEGNDYKFGQLIFDESFMYTVTDYANVQNLLPKGILKCPMDKLSTPAAYTNAWQDSEGQILAQAGLVSLLIDSGYRKIMTIDSYQPGYIFVALEGTKFKRVSLGQSTQFGIRFTGPNYNGEFYATFKTFDMTKNACSLNFYPTINVTELMRENGIKWTPQIAMDKSIW